MLQHNIYRGVSPKNNFGAIQFSPKGPEYNEDGKGGKEGVIFVNACSSTGPNIYDWDNKFTFALGIDDIGKILHFFTTAGEKGSLSLVHDPNMKQQGAGQIMKSMNFYTANGCLDGLMITTTTKKGEEVVSHKIPVSGGEVMVLKALFDIAIPLMMGWL